MDEKNISASVSAVPTQGPSATEQATAVQSAEPSAERAGSEHRQAYGTAKTENLRDSGFYRFLWPAAVIVFCLALVAIPLFILIPLLITSINAIGNNQGEAQLLWIWITMIILEMAIVFVIVRGLFKVFLTQAGNYPG